MAPSRADSLRAHLDLDYSFEMYVDWRFSQILNCSRDRRPNEKGLL